MLRNICLRKNVVHSYVSAGPRTSLCGALAPAIIFLLYLFTERNLNHLSLSDTFNLHHS